MWAPFPAERYGTPHRYRSPGTWQGWGRATLGACLEETSTPIQCGGECGRPGRLGPNPFWLPAHFMIGTEPNVGACCVENFTLVQCNGECGECGSPVLRWFTWSVVHLVPHGSPDSMWFTWYVVHLVSLVPSGCLLMSRFVQSEQAPIFQFCCKVHLH